MVGLVGDGVVIEVDGGAGDFIVAEVEDVLAAALGLEPTEGTKPFKVSRHRDVFSHHCTYLPRVVAT